MELEDGPASCGSVSLEGQPLDDRRHPDLKVVLIKAWSVLGRCDDVLQPGWQPALLALADQLQATSMVRS